MHNCRLFNIYLFINIYFYILFERKTNLRKSFVYSEKPKLYSLTITINKEVSVNVEWRPRSHACMHPFSTWVPACSSMLCNDVHNDLTFNILPEHTFCTSIASMWLSTSCITGVEGFLIVQLVNYLCFIVHNLWE